MWQEIWTSGSVPVTRHNKRRIENSVDIVLAYNNNPIVTSLVYNNATVKKQAKYWSCLPSSRGLSAPCLIAAKNALDVFSSSS